MSEIPLDVRAGLELMGSLMAANARQAEATTNSIFAFKDREIRELRELVRDMVAIWESAAVIDRTAERDWIDIVEVRAFMVIENLKREALR
ncbi:hypothetical protein [Nocardioides sp. GY 10127]|uniref:hypothetical protein n=1 Tax=Nocardioides sp. GY 10127 TaxID=2569762 RepID=UPI0010A8B9FE|nr:hypothetical protein [Nocardioides sp. GY 10127]TIC78797.1 hypothetical protein E8D37_19060 [Nocardioides sp. GY 10127]